MTIYESKGIVERCLRWFGKGFGKQHTDLILNARQNLPDPYSSGFRGNTAYKNYYARDGQPPADPDMLSWAWTWVPRKSASLVVDEPLNDEGILKRLSITFIAQRSTSTIEISDLQLANSANHWVIDFIPRGIIGDYLTQGQWVTPPSMQIVYGQVDPLQRRFVVTGARAYGPEGPFSKRITYGNLT